MWLKNGKIHNKEGKKKEKEINEKGGKKKWPST